MTVNTTRPATVAMVPPATIMRCRGLIRCQACFSCSTTLFCIGQRPSELHLFHLLISTDDLVAHLHHQLKSHIGLLDRHHGATYVCVTFSLQKVHNLLVRIILQRVHIAYGRLKYIGKV